MQQLLRQEDGQLIQFQYQLKIVMKKLLLDLDDFREKEQQEFSLVGNIDVSDVGGLFKIVKNQPSIRSLSILVCHGGKWIYF